MPDLAFPTASCFPPKGVGSRKQEAGTASGNQWEAVGSRKQADPRGRGPALREVTEP